MNRQAPVCPNVAKAAFIAAVAGLWPATAGAHLVTSGLGPIYDGILHTLLSAEDLVPVLAMALLAGLNGRVACRRTLFALTASWLLGGIAGYVVGRAPFPGMVTTASFLLPGALIAMDRRLPPAVVSAIAIAVGLLHGCLNGSGIADERREALALVGVASVVFVVVAIMSALVVSVRPPWTRVAVRVVGSWIAAIGLLMLGWKLRGQ
jgi:hydrogenase/urease accessory protein HupE